MQLKRIGFGLLVLIVAGSLFGWKAWQGQKETAQGTVAATQIKPEFSR